MQSLAKRRIRIRCRFSLKNNVTLFHGDCLNLLKAIPDKAVQLVVTSPPYNVGKSYESRLSFEEYLAQQTRVIAECVRVLKPGGSLCWQVGHHVNGYGQVIPLDLALHPLFAQHDLLRLRNRIVWHFEHGLHCTHRFSGRHETILAA
jgi:adenine-specific DNA-methyltransferase